MLRSIALCGLLSGTAANAQFTMADVQYWTGAGADSSVLVVDFQDGSFDGHSYAWGYLHDGSATAADMLNAISAADINFDVDIGGGFLNDITYGVHAGIGGAPDYWSTWSGTDIASMAMNAGIGEPLSNGAWFACSYTDFAPPLPPTEPIPAFDPLAFTANEVTFWVGSGAHAAVLVVDFQEGGGTSSYAWGYRFDGSTTGEAMLTAIAAADPALAVALAGGFLNDITYGAHAGIGGSPNFWGTWSATNLGNWTMNMGVGTEVNDGDLFGCSYTDFAPALRPNTPVAAGSPTGIAAAGADMLLIYPQPATEQLFLRGGDMPLAITVFDATGRRMAELAPATGLSSIDVGAWPAGVYVVQAGLVKRSIVVQ